MAVARSETGHSVQLGHGLVEVLAEFGHATVELVDLVLADEPDGGFEVGKRHRLPGGHELVSDVGHGEEGRMAGVQQFLTRGQVLAFGAEGVGGLTASIVRAN